MASTWWRFCRGASSSSHANFLHLSRTNIRRICELITELDKVYAEPLNPHQCRSMSSKLTQTMASIERIVDSSENQHYNLLCGSAALENFYRVSEKAKQLVQDCCSPNWCQASAFQIQNEEAFKEILLETSLCHNTIHKLAEDLNRKRTFEHEVLRLSLECEPPSAEDVLKDGIALFNRLKNLVNDSRMLISSDMRSVHLAKYLLGRLHYVDTGEDFDVRCFSLRPHWKGLHEEWSKECEYLGGNVCKTTWLNVPCAKKFFKDEQLEPPQWLAEAKLLASLNHPNIVKFLCCNKYETPHSSGHFIAMEQMETCLGSFIKRLKKSGASSLSLLSALDIILQIVYGMCYLHKRGVAHRDLKTSNVVVRSIIAPHLQYHLQVKIADFGLSKAKLNLSKSNTISHPKTGTTVYMPPEAFTNSRANWFKADVYSFSVMCSVILTGDEPFLGVKRADLYGAICRGERPGLPGNLPKELKAVITEGWATERDLRPDFVHIRSRLEKLRHRLLRENTLGGALKQEESDYSDMYIENRLKSRHVSWEHDRRLHVRPKSTPLNNSMDEEDECFDGDESSASNGGATVARSEVRPDPASGGGGSHN